MNTPFSKALHALSFGIVTAFIIAALCLTRPVFTTLGLPDYVFTVFVTILGSYLGLKIFVREPVPAGKV